MSSMGRSRRKQAGFSLLELMAVIFIIGLAIGVASLSISRGGYQEQLWDMLDKFLGYSQFASDQAVLTGQTVGLKLEPPVWQYETDRERAPDEIGWRYTWVLATPVGWQNIPNVNPVELPPNIDLEIEVDGTLWEYEKQLDRSMPVAAFYSSGDITDISILLFDKSFPEYAEKIYVNESGKLVVESEEEARLAAEESTRR